eukprot:6126249-Pyramimonas_sp.AAC.1
MFIEKGEDGLRLASRPGGVDGGALTRSPRARPGWRAPEPDCRTPRSCAASGDGGQPLVGPAVPRRELCLSGGQEHHASRAHVYDVANRNVQKCKGGGNGGHRGDAR